MSGSSTSREPAAKLTGGLLARKGKARPADLLEGDSLLVTTGDRPSLTLVRDDETVDKGLFDDDGASPQDETAAGGSDSLLNFSLARPGTGELDRVADHSQASGPTPAVMADASGPEAGGTTLEAHGPHVAEAATRANENQQPPGTTSDPAMHDGGGPLDAEPVKAKPLGAEFAKAEGNKPMATKADDDPTEPADGYLRKVLILATLLVVSFAAGLWIVSWGNKAPQDQVRTLNLPLQSEQSGPMEIPSDQAKNDADVSGALVQEAPRDPLLAPPDTTKFEADVASPLDTKDVLEGLEDDSAPDGIGLNAAPVADTLPTLDSTPGAPEVALEPMASDEAPVSNEVSVESVAVLEPEGNLAAEPSRPIAPPEELQVLPSPKPNPKRDEDASSETAAAAVAEKPGYVVQLLAGQDLKTVTWEKERLLRRFPQVAGGGDLEVLKVESAGGRVFYRVRTVPFDDAAAARALCRALKAKNQDCLVLKQ